jgi:ribosomal protein L9
MPKRTVSEKNKTESKRQYDSPGQNNIKGSLEATSLSINKPDLIKIEIFDSEKTEKIVEDSNSKDLLSDKISAQRKFDEYLFEAIDEALTSLGAPVKNAVYFQLENSFNMPKNEIPKQIEGFVDIMHKIFGLGASRLEIKFMKNLQSKIKVNIELTEYEWPLSKWILADMSFKEYVYSARKKYCNL